MKIPLLDLDGTVVKGHNRVHKDALNYVYKSVYGINASMDEISYDGKIDSLIIIEILRLYNIPEEEIFKKLPLAFDVAIKYFFKHINKSEITALPGVKELLEELKNKKAIIGVLTGNIEDIGWKKLEVVGLKKFIDFGAFGNLAYKRVDLIDVALKRVRKKLKPNAKRKDLVIIGDTPRDVACAKEGSIESIAVASGFHEREVLEKLSPDLIVGSLEEKEKVLNFLGA